MVRYFHNKAVIVYGCDLWLHCPTQLSWSKYRQFSVSHEVLNMLRISRLTANWWLFVESSF